MPPYARSGLRAALLLLWCATAPARAEILPSQIVVVANSRHPESTQVAEHYLAARGVPKNNLVMLSLPVEETMSRETFDSELVAALRAELERRKLAETTRVLLTVLGVPLRVAAPEAGNEEKQLLLDALARQRLSRAAIFELSKSAQAIAAEITPQPQRVEQISDQALIQKVDRELREAGIRISKLPPEKQPEQGQKLSEVVARFGGFTAVVQNLRPKEGGDTAEAEAALKKLKADIASAEKLLTVLNETASPENRRRSYELIQRLYGAIGVLGRATSEIQAKSYEAADASVDSELSLLWWDRDMYSLPGRLPNPYFYSALAAQPQFPLKLRLLMVSRIDAPSAALAKQMITGSLQAEHQGLQGTVYIDARGKKFSRKDVISVWDQNLRDLAWALRRSTRYEVEVDNSDQLLEEAKDTAIYVGWYSLRNFQDVFSFRPGAIAYHIASEEAVSIRKPEEKGWCKNLLQRGAAVTLGAIAEPYLDSFPLPREFYGLLLSGRYSLVEVFYLTSRYTSWRMVLFGDPLYNPWRGRGTVPLKEINLMNEAGEQLTAFPPAPGQLALEDPLTVRKLIEENRRQRKSEIERLFKGGKRPG